jgi:hypothetical protein
MKLTVACGSRSLSPGRLGFRHQGKGVGSCRRPPLASNIGQKPANCLVRLRGHPILHTIQGRMNACQHYVPVCIKRKGKKNKPREALQTRIVQKSELGLGHIITEEGVSEIKSYDAANRSYKNNGLCVRSQG